MKFHNGSWRVLKSGAEGARTPDLLAASQTLSQLSYSPSFNDERLSILFDTVN